MTVEAMKARTPDELKWMRRYQRLTGFEPTLDTDKCFELFAQTNIKWFEDWSHDVLSSISKPPTRGYDSTKGK